MAKHFFFELLICANKLLSLLIEKQSYKHLNIAFSSVPISVFS